MGGGVELKEHRGPLRVGEIDHRAGKDRPLHIGVGERGPLQRRTSEIRG